MTNELKIYNGFIRGFNGEWLNLRICNFIYVGKSPITGSFYIFINGNDFENTISQPFDTEKEAQAELDRVMNSA